MEDPGRGGGGGGAPEGFLVVGGGGGGLFPPGGGGGALGGAVSERVDRIEDGRDRGLGGGFRRFATSGLIAGEDSDACAVGRRGGFGALPVGGRGAELRVTSESD